MGYVHKVLAEPTVIKTTATNIFVNNMSGLTLGAFMRTIVLFNPDTVASTVKLYKVPNSSGSVGTLGVTNQFYQETIEAAGMRIIDLEAQGMMFQATNDTLQGTATTTTNKPVIQAYGGTI